MTNGLEKAKKLTGLIERVRAATGPDRELDLDIAAALFTDGEDAAWWARRKERFLSSHMLVDAAPEYTASIDAVVALIERKLPGWNWVANRRGKPMALVNNGPAIQCECAEAASIPLALCLAFLTALQSLDTGGGEG